MSENILIGNEDFLGCYFDFTKENFDKLTQEGFKCEEIFFDNLEYHGCNYFLAIEREEGDLIGINKGFDLTNYDYSIWDEDEHSFVKSVYFKTTNEEKEYEWNTYRLEKIYKNNHYSRFAALKKENGIWEEEKDVDFLFNSLNHNSFILMDKQNLQIVKKFNC